MTVTQCVASSRCRSSICGPRRLIALLLSLLFHLPTTQRFGEGANESRPVLNSTELGRFTDRFYSFLLMAQCTHCDGLNTEQE